MNKSNSMVHLSLNLTSGANNFNDFAQNGDGTTLPGGGATTLGGGTAISDGGKPDTVAEQRSGWI